MKKIIKVVLLLLGLSASIVGGLIFGSWWGQKDVSMYEKGNFSYLDKNNSNPQIIVYTSKTCKYCIKLKEHLDSKAINYSERDIHGLKEHKEEYASLNTKYTPVTIIDEKHKVIGFNIDKIEELLGDKQ